MKLAAASTSHGRRARSCRYGQSGFTLTELMVAVTGGLFISIVVFMIARDGSRFYQRESRVANATLGVITGFERLRADITRAGFLASPNLRKDPRFCGSVTDPGWSALTELNRLAALRVDPGGSLDVDAGNDVFSNNGLTPDRLVLAGSYASVDQFPIRGVEDLGTYTMVYLQVATGPMARLGYSSAGSTAAQKELLASIFGTGRVLRIVDKAGDQHYGIITNVAGGTQPSIELAAAPKLRFKSSAATICGLRGNETGGLANVVNFIQYDLRNLTTNSNFGGANADYAALYETGATGPYDDKRTELVRVELDATGTPIAGTEELVAEYAVDLRFGVIVAEPGVTGPTLKTIRAEDTTDVVVNWAGDTISESNAINRGPHLVRVVSTRLGVRSREADRETGVTATATVAPGLYRIRLGNDAFARVRTLQADIGLRNHKGAQWP
jgi:hypothetical protein